MAGISYIIANNEESRMEIYTSMGGTLYRQEFGENHAIALTSVTTASTIYDKTAEPGVYYQYRMNSDTWSNAVIL
jgi:hypothetical protein